MHAGDDLGDATGKDGQTIAYHFLRSRKLLEWKSQYDEGHVYLFVYSISGTRARISFVLNLPSK